MTWASAGILISCSRILALAHQFARKLQGMPSWIRAWRRGLAAISPRTHQAERLQWRQYADHRRWVIALSKLVAATWSVPWGGRWSGRG